MTIIAYRDGVLAADRCIWSGSNQDHIRVHRTKAHRLRGGDFNGSLYAGAGYSGEIIAARLWLEGEGPRPPNMDRDAFEAIIVKPDGTFFWMDPHLSIIATPANYYCLGSHSTFLAGALAAGATATYALRLCMKHSDAGVSPIDVLDIRGEQYDHIIESPFT